MFLDDMFLFRILSDVQDFLTSDLFTCLDFKDSFLRALREVAPEMELFLENHGQYIKKKFYISPFYKKVVSHRY